jgi:hypothetical protein
LENSLLIVWFEWVQSAPALSPNKGLIRERWSRPQPSISIFLPEMQKPEAGRRAKGSRPRTAMSEEYENVYQRATQ